MFRKILGACCLGLMVAASAWAGDMDTNASADAMMKEMSNCYVCRHLVPHMETLGPVMTMDVSNLNDGVAFLHGVSDPAQLATYRKVSAEMAQAGEECMDFSDEKAQAELCPLCQGIRNAVHAGAHMSMGDTKMGDMMILTSDDPAVQKDLGELATKCEMMASKM